ncbi:uncharacterized protein EKO05_0002675 [Ascochyta rabiei]|uniref:uncharacterized protein n=1 Tax=Didymella rabiei TaxID=5454 RepID=UPI00220871F6|nr:uncharacterized protein EKO05_0002675 [Ascochyta rabiei]UPX12104.1 hypothetical protein EKO05_0002675 [Ascochyta rabiei]
MDRGRGYSSNSKICVHVATPGTCTTLNPKPPTHMQAGGSAQCAELGSFSRHPPRRQTHVSWSCGSRSSEAQLSASEAMPGKKLPSSTYHTPVRVTLLGSDAAAGTLHKL